MSNQDLVKMEKVLKDFASVGLKPSDYVLDEGKRLVQEVFKVLQDKTNNPKYKIDRTLIGGSVGKQTGIGTMFDFDCVVMINKEYPLYEELLKDFKDILAPPPGKGSPPIQFDYVELTKYSLKCGRNEFFHIDLLPATNFSTNMKSQLDSVLSKMSSLNLKEVGTGGKYSSSLVESQIGVLNKQSGFVHELCRLCKFWNKTLYLTEGISGRSSTFELVAIYVGQKEEKANQSVSFLRAFKAFLNEIKNFNKINIALDDQKPGVSMNPPIILDPTNHFHNFADPFLRVSEEDGKKLFEKFEKYADESLKKLEKYASSNYPLENIFEPQPSGGLADKEAKIKQCRIDVMVMDKDKLPNIKVHNKQLKWDDKKSDKLHRLDRIVQTFICTPTLACMNSQIANMNMDHIKQLAEKNVRGSLFGGAPGDIFASGIAHDKFDVTFGVPFKPVEGCFGNKGVWIEASFTFQ